MQKIHQETTVAITHDHTMYSLAKRRKAGEKAVFLNHYAPIIRKGGVNVIGWVIGGDPPFFGINSDDAWWGTLELLDMIWQEAEESEDVLAICKNCSEIDQAVSAGKVAILLTMEGGMALNDGSNPLIKLRTLYRLGLRSFQFVGQDWNNLITASREHPIPSNGLSSLGKEIVREMNNLGMIIDTSHIPDPDPVFQDILEINQHPIIDSHRGVRGVTDLPRNISDERITAIAKTDGVIGLQFFSLVLANEPDRRATVNDLIRHINYIVEVAGIDHVSLGPDFLDSKLANRSSDHYIEGIGDLSNLHRVTDALVNGGYSDSDIRKILGENILRVYKQVLG
jgi:membrane dipeptidase